MIPFRVLLVTDANRAQFEQSDNSGQHLFATEPWPSNVLARLRPDARESLAESDHVVVFVFVTDLAPSAGVKELFSGSGVAPRRPQKPVCIWTDPHVAPGPADRPPFVACERVGGGFFFFVWR